MKLTEEKRFFLSRQGSYGHEKRRFLAICNTASQHPGRTSAVHHDLSVYMPLSLQNNLLDLHRHHFIFRYSRPFRLDCQDDLYSHFQHSERGHRLRSSMVVSPPYGITTRLDWPRLNSGVFMSGKNYRYSAPGIATGMPVTVHDTIVCNDRHAIREGRLFS